MKFLLTPVFLVFWIHSYTQLSNLQLNNVLIVGLLDKPEDRYTIEINLAELFAGAGIRAIPSLNMMKQGNDIATLTKDSIQRVVMEKGIDTYLLVSVRGFDRKFKPSVRKDDLNTALGSGTLFPIYRSEAASVSFEFQFYRNGEFIAGDMIRCRNISERDTVIKRFRSSVKKHLQKKWK